MSNAWIQSAVALLFGTWLALPGWAEDIEEDLPLGKVPKPIMKTVKDRFPDAKPVSAVYGQDKEGAYYEVALLVKHAAPKPPKKGEIPPPDRHIFIVFDAAGVVHEISKELAVKDVPEPVAKAISGKFPKSTIEMALEQAHETPGVKQKLTFDLLVAKADKKKVHLTIDPKGKILKEEAVKEEKK